MATSEGLELSAEKRDAVWRELVRVIEGYIADVDSLRVTPPLDPDALRKELAAKSFATPMDAVEAVRYAADSLTNSQVHTPHAMYYGLFNPAPTFMGIAADALVAAFNPQLAAWSHSPFAAEVERHLIQQFGIRFGLSADSIDGTFCSGGAEANHTALLTALTDKLPAYQEAGTAGLPGQPTLYITADSHDSVRKAARVSGIGKRAIRVVPTDARYRMDLVALSRMIQSDREEGMIPFLVVATAGTTGSGAVDPLHEIADIAWTEGLWFHVDAAWGGGAAFSPTLRKAIAGVERADSITFDAHKWLSVPMGAGVYITRHPKILTRTFETVNPYMPRDASGLDIVDPFSHSLQWSRRAIGMKVFLSMLVAGWDGYREAIEHQAAMGAYLRERLVDAGWRVLNDTPMPLVCFVPANHTDPSDRASIDAIVQRVVRSGDAWVSSTVLGGKQAAIRACITNYRTQKADVDRLVEVLGA